MDTCIIIVTFPNYYLAHSFRWSWNILFAFSLFSRYNLSYNWIMEVSTRTLWGVLCNGLFSFRFWSPDSGLVTWISMLQSKRPFSWCCCRILLLLFFSNEVNELWLVVTCILSWYFWNLFRFHLKNTMPKCNNHQINVSYFNLNSQFLFLSKKVKAFNCYTYFWWQVCSFNGGTRPCWNHVAVFISQKQYLH